MSTLVTGCAGFIGASVCGLLLQEGALVRGADNLNDAYDVRVKRWRLERLNSQPGFSFHNTDICDRVALRSLFTEDPPRQVVHLGARAGVRASVSDPWAYYEANVVGTLNLLELCREFGVEKFVLASTSSVYGADTPRPFSEDSDTSRPLSPYAASKKAAETLVYAYHHLHRLDATVLRYFTVYGPAGRPDMSVFRFVRAIAEEEPITVTGDGRQERDFTFVDDVAGGTVAALKPLGYEVINIGGDRPVVLADLIEIIEGALGKTATVQYAPMPAADVPATWADVRRAEKLLGWRPQVPIEEGVERTVRWYMDNREWAKEIR